MAITITPTQLLPLQVRVQKPLDLKTLFGVVDTAGTIDHYKIAATAGFGGSITDVTTSTTIVAGQNLTAAAGDTLTYTASSSVGAESFTLQASDDGTGTIFSSPVTVSENVVANTAPTVMAVVNDANTLTINKTFNAAQLFQATDVNFDPIASYTFTTPAAGGGVFTLGGGAHTTDVSNATGALAANTTYTISGADLANLTFKTSGTSGNTSFQVAANDGLQTGASLTVTLNVRLNTLPTVATPPPAKPILIGNTLTAASSLIKASDLDGSTITGYSIQAQPSNNGFFTTDGTHAVALDVNNQFFVTAAQFATLQYRSNTTTAGTDQFTVTAIATPDLTQPANVVFSPVTPLNVKVVASAPPVVTQNAGASSLATGATVSASSLFTAVDPKGGPVKGYSIIPSESGQFQINGVALAANTPTFVSAANFPLLQFVADATPGTTQFQVAASDGTSLGSFATITINASAAAAPSITTPATTPVVEPNSPVAASTLFSGSEAGGSIQGFSIIVPSTLGHLTLNGTTLATDQPVFVSSADFANLKFVATAAPGAATLRAAAYDGKVFSAYANVPLNLVGPTVTQGTGIGANSLVVSKTYSASSLFSVQSVAGGAPVTGLSIQTPPASEGTFFNGATALASNQPVFVNASDLANLTLHTSASAGPVLFQVSAFDGLAFGAPKQFSLASVANSEPTVTPTGANPQVTVGHSMLASTLFSANDVNGDTITAYQITPGTAPGAGVFSGGGLIFTPGSATTVTTAQLATLKYTAGGPSPLITLAGNVTNPGGGGGIEAIPGSYTFTTDDGATYNATLQLDFANATSAQLEVATLTANAGSPAITNPAPFSLGTVAFNGGGTATGFTPAAATVTVSAAGRLLLSGTTLDFSALTATGAATAVTTGVASFQTGQDSFTVSATDDPGAADFSQSTPATIKVVSVANQPATTIALPQTLPILTGSSVSGTSLFSTSDPEGDAIQGYSIVAPPASAGSFSGFTSQDPATGLIYVKAADLANLKFTAGSQPGPASFQIAAFDGNSWGASATVPLSIVAPRPASISLTPPTVLRPNASIAASSLFSATDPRGNTIQGYSITTPTGNNGFFTLNGVALPAGTQNYVSAAQLSSLAFVGGQTSAQASFTVAAFNGLQWSDLSSESVNVSAYRAPTVVAASTLPSVVAGAGTSVASFVTSVSTDSNAPVQQYVVSASDGSFTLNGQTRSATTPLTVSAADFANLQYVAPTTTGDVTFNIAANDGTATGASIPLTLSVTANAGPTIAALPPPAQVIPGQAIAASQLFSATDNTGNAITSYIVQVNSGDGTFQLNGVALPTTGPQTVNAGDLAKLTFIPGQKSTSFTVSANDAVSTGKPTTILLSPFQSADSIVVPANPVPTVAHSTTIPVKQLLSGLAGIGKTLQGFNLSSDGGSFLLNNVPLTAAQASLVSAADFANLLFSAPSTAGTVHITSSAWDGTVFGPPVTLALTIT